MLLTTTCFTVLLFLWYFSLIWQMPKNIWKTIHEAPKSLWLWWALVSLAPCFFMNHLKIANLIPEPSFTVSCQTYPSLHPNWYHQIVYCKFNLEIVHTPPYLRCVWDFMNKTVHEQVPTFKSILMNIFSINISPINIQLLMIKILHGWQKL